MSLLVRRVLLPSLLAAALAAPLLGGRTALAAPKAGAETPAMAEARRHFEVGLALLKEKNFTGALSEFREAYALSKRHSALRNIAQCERELHHYAAAYRSLEQLLAVHGGDLKPADKAAIARALEELRQLTAVVDVRVTPAGAEVGVDGVRAGVTPLERFRVDSGARQIRVTKAGFDPFERTVEIASMKDTVVSGELAAEVSTGHLVVRESTGAAVTVFLDGKSVGKAPFEGDVAPGSHIVEGRGDRVASKPRNVDVAKRARVEVTLETVPLLGKLRVRAIPADASLRVDGGAATAGSFDGELPIGSHTVVVEAPGYARIERLLDVTAGETIVQEITLTAIPKPQEPVPVARQEEPRGEPEPVYEGLYSQLAVHYAQGVTPFSAVPCPNDGLLYQCDTGAPMGGGTSLRFGYSTGLIGFEAALLGSIDVRSDGRRVLTSPAPTTAALDVERSYFTMRGFAGGGLRLLTPGSVRFTLGATPGYVLQSYGLTNRYTNGSSYRVSASGGNFAMLVDMGLVIGPSPGTKLLLGVVAFADFVGEDMYTPTGRYVDAKGTSFAEPAYQVAPSMNWMILPTLGFQFGH